MEPGLRVAVRAACGAAVLLLAAVLTGCASGPSPSDMLWARSDLLYLQEEPYRRMVVEISRMEDAEFPEYLVEEVKAFLGGYCVKPDGVEVVLKAPIPLSALEGFPLGAASILSTDGPLDDGRPQPAYLHLFVYNGKTAFKGAAPNPRVTITGPLMVFWNTDYMRTRPAARNRHSLRHELGHALGLCNDATRCKGGHCRRYGCLMHSQPDLLSQFGGLFRVNFREHVLCDDCERDLSLAREGPMDDTLSFAGPFLVRRADGYYVASLVGYDMVIRAPTPDEFDWRKALQHAKTCVGRRAQNALDEGRDLRTAHRAVWVCLPGVPQAESCPQGLEQDIAFLSKVANDPSPSVRLYASRILKERQEALEALSR